MQTHCKKSVFTALKDGWVALKGKINKALFSINNRFGWRRKSALSKHVHSKRISPRNPWEIWTHLNQTSQATPGWLNTKSEKENFECKSCVLSKITKQLFKKQSTLAEKPFQRLNLDLIGPIQPESTHKHQYVLNLIDNSSRYIAGFPLTHKKYNRCPHQSVDSQREMSRIFPKNDLLQWRRRIH